MTAKDIFNNYLLLDKPVKLEFYTREDINNFLATLRVYKQRYCKQIAKLGLAEFDHVTGKSIDSSVELVEDKFKVTVQLAEPKQSMQFKIVE